MGSGVETGSCEAIAGIEIDIACFPVVAYAKDRPAVGAGDCHAIPDYVGYVLSGRLLQQVKRFRIGACAST